MSDAQPLPLPLAACHRALQARDPRFDGRFFTAVRTTGIYCRPICPARTPLPRNVTFYATAAAAETAGFRPCRRCRPEAAPGSPAWQGTGATAARALRLIEEGALDEGSVELLADRLGLGSRHLRRLLLAHAGATPLRLALTRRLHFARRLLVETRLPVAAVARASGFGSERRFRDAFQSAFGFAPSLLRRKSAEAGTAERPLEISLAYRPPLQAGALLAFLEARAIPGCERVEDGTWSTTARFGRHAGEVTARFDERARCVRIGAPPAFAPHLLEIVARVRRLLDLDSDPLAIATHFCDDDLLRRLIRKRPGLRSPGAWDPFTAAVRILLGQQVSVKAATTISGRVAESFGERVGGVLVFPDEGRLAAAPLERCGLPPARATAIRRFAEACLSKDSPLVPRSLDETLRRLEALPGVGAWTSNAIAMRALGEPDAFPAGDLVIARALGGQRAAEARAEAWRPFRACAAMHLWTEAAG